MYVGSISSFNFLSRQNLNCLYSTILRTKRENRELNLDRFIILINLVGNHVFSYLC